MDGLEELMSAVQQQDAARVRSILQQDSSLARARTDSGRTPVLMATYCGGGECLEVLLKVAGQDLDACEAAAVGDAERLASLRASDPDSLLGIGADGASPLHFAAFLGNEDCVGVLLEAGADVHLLSTNENRNTPLHAALAGRCQEGIVRALLAAGADPNARGALDFTPLHLAAARGNCDMIERLAAHGARATATTQGQRPLDLAQEHGHEEAAARLRKLGLV